MNFSNVTPSDDTLLSERRSHLSANSPHGLMTDARAALRRECNRNRHRIRRALMSEEAIQLLRQKDRERYHRRKQLGKFPTASSTPTRVNRSVWETHFNPVVARPVSDVDMASVIDVLRDHAAHEASRFVGVPTKCDVSAPF